MTCLQCINMINLVFQTCFFLHAFVQVCGGGSPEDSMLIHLPGEELKSHLPESGTTLVFFTKPTGCGSCAVAEAQLRAAISDLTVPAVTYSVHDPAVTPTYADRVPALVMFHGHTPVLYEGPMEADAFSEFIMSNREPRVVHLTDETFEHLTQAATGATTGDWLVMFHGLECARCAALESRLQGVAAKLRNRVMVAKLSSQTDGRQTAARFHVLPARLTLLFFRQGVMYTYTSDRTDLSSLSAFAVGLYKEAPSEPVPGLPQGPLMLIAQIIAGVLIMAYIISVFIARKHRDQQKKGF